MLIFASLTSWVIASAWWCMLKMHDDEYMYKYDDTIQLYWANHHTILWTNQWLMQISFCHKIFANYIYRYTYLEQLQMLQHWVNFAIINILIYLPVLSLAPWCHSMVIPFIMFFVLANISVVEQLSRINLNPFGSCLRAPTNYYVETPCACPTSDSINHTDATCPIPASIMMLSGGTILYIY